MPFRLPASLDFEGLPASVNGFTTASAEQKAGEAMLRAQTDFSSTGQFTSAVASPLGSTVVADYGLGAGSYLGGEGLRMPASSQISATMVNQQLNANGPSPNDDSHMVSLLDQDGYLLKFKVMPEISENRAADYEPVQPVQFPGAFMKYKGTNPTDWQINATLISRTSEEASENLRHIYRIRSWLMPFFGENTASRPSLTNGTIISYADRKGAPPMVLRLKGLRGLVGDVPVVLKTASWNWPKDVDYLPATPTYMDPRYTSFPRMSEVANDAKSSVNPNEQPVPFPAVIQITLSLVESFSTTEMNQFSLFDFQQGVMTAAYGRPVKKTSYQTEGATYEPPVINEPPIRNDPAADVSDEIRRLSNRAPDIRAVQNDPSWIEKRNAANSNTVNPNGLRARVLRK